jgi:hypothetical protein
MEVIMKKTLLLAGVLLALTASVAMAAGISVTWGNDCWGLTPVSNLTWACSSNSNSNIRMMCTFKPAVTKTTFAATDLYMEGMSETATVPDWWKLGTGECRPTALSLSVDGGNISDPATCLDLWQSQGGGGIANYWENNDRMHIIAVWAVADPLEAPAETEIMAAQFRVSGTKTVGTECTGCATGVCWALNYIQVGYLYETTPTILDTPFAGGNQVLTWQSSTLNCNAVPSRNTTWGQIKSLYR